MQSTRYIFDHEKSAFQSAFATYGMILRRLAGRDLDYIENELVNLTARWRAERYRAFSRKPNGINVRVSRKSALLFRLNSVSFDGVTSDIHLATRMTAEYLRDRGEGVITITSGCRAYKMSLWAHARLMNMVVIGFNPIPTDQNEVVALVDELRAKYKMKGTTPERYRPPQLVQSHMQMYYMLHRGQHLRDMRF